MQSNPNGGPMSEMTATHKEKLMTDLKLVIADAEELFRQSFQHRRGRVLGSRFKTKLVATYVGLSINDAATFASACATPPRARRRRSRARCAAASRSSAATS